jgi:hypothetical protein
VKAFVFAAAVLAVGCHTPCERTARHAMAMGRACVEVGDPALRGVCERAYEAVREGLSGGACAAEVVK